jgi:hypothetical protein
VQEKSAGDEADDDFDGSECAGAAPQTIQFRQYAW